MIIQEFLPNPVGSDTDGEYIKLLNDGSSKINFSGWIIKDTSGKTFRLSGFLDAGQELVLPYSQTKIALNNNGEQVLLYNAGGNLVDELNYSGQAKEGELITRIINQESLVGQAGVVEIQESSVTDGNNFFLIPDSLFLIYSILIATILAGLSLYIILQLEDKLDIKLF
ncbi:lamin tail domain-containing protein [Candidatus Wolfebacteria bacterium]|nr:lamin tail domain-containing protein [Candidatus Wolfebacteria bacterium]